MAEYAALFRPPAVENQRLYEGLRAIYKETVRAFAAAIDIKDRYTQGHSVRVGKYSEVIARAMGWSDDQVEGITIAGYLHDIGKLIVDLSVINSPERFSAKDSKEMSRHPSAGYEILARINHPYAEIPLMARYHHERIDGKGYPDGLKGDQIPPGAKIVTLADSFDAMTTDRPYRKKLALADVFEDFRINTGTQFDPAVVCAFCRAFLKEVEGKKERRLLNLLNRNYDNLEAVTPLLNQLLADRAVSRNDRDRNDPVPDTLKEMRTSVRSSQFSQLLLVPVRLRPDGNLRRTVELKDHAI